jgi:hypothetical protein
MDSENDNINKAKSYYDIDYENEFEFQIKK